MKNKKILFPVLFSAVFCLVATWQAKASGLVIGSPTAGQIWAAGSTQTITWSPNNPPTFGLNQVTPSVFIDLNSASPCPESSSASCSGIGSVPYIIAQNAPDSGSFTWSIPSTIEMTYQGPVTLTVGLSDSSAQGTSAQFYFVAPNPYLSTSSSIISPNGGQQWTIGSNENIQWSDASSTISSVDINLVPINLSACSGNCATASSTIYSIASNIPNNGTYPWSINDSLSGQAIPPGQYIISISDASDGNIIGSSAGALTLIASKQTTASASSTLPEISGISPNSGNVGQIVNVIGSGFAPTGNSLQFGPSTYINNLSSANGSSLQFTVPAYTQPCPANTNEACPLFVSLINAGAYGVSVSNTNGTSNTMPFEVSGSPESGPIGTSAGTTAPMTFQNDSLVMVSGSLTVYLVNSGQFVPFSNAQIFLAYGYQWSQIHTISAAQFNPQNISASFVLAPNGSIIKSGDNPTVYLVVNGQKSAIPSLNVFSNLGLSFNNLIVVSDQELQNYPSTQAQQ